jgi:hypothetical protein
MRKVGIQGEKNSIYREGWETNLRPHTPKHQPSGGRKHGKFREQKI